MTESLVIRSVPLDVAVYSVFRMAERLLGTDFDVLDYGEYAPVWKMVGDRLGRNVSVRPRQRRLPLIGPWDLPAGTTYEKAFVLGSGPRGGLDQVMALARTAAKQPLYYDLGREIADSIADLTDLERIDTECRFLPESVRAGNHHDFDFRVIRIDLLGDLSYTIPLLVLLKEFFPAKRLSLTVDKRLGEVARRLTMVDHVETIDMSGYDSFHADLKRIAQSSADWQLLPLGGGWRRDVAAYVHRVLPANRKISRMDFEDATTRSVRSAGGQEVVEIASMALTPMAAMAAPVDSVQRYLRPQPLTDLFALDAPSTVVRQLHITEQDLLLAPIGGSAERDWTSSGWSQTARCALGAIPGRLILVGDRTDRQCGYNGRLAKLVGSDRLIDLSGQTDFHDLLNIASRAGGYLGTNTAPMHLVALQGKPVVALNSPFEAPHVWRYPFGDAVLIPGRRLLNRWQQPDLSDCIERVGQRSLAPECADYRYSVDQVTDAVSAVFGKTSRILQKEKRQAS